MSSTLASASRTSRWRRIALFLAMVGVTVAAVGAASSTAQANGDPSTAPVDEALGDEARPVEMTAEIAARGLSRDTGIAYEDALAAAIDTRPLGDYIRRYWTSREVGAVWATYDGGYRVHLREIDGQDPRVAEELARQLSAGHMVMHHGGASLGAMNAAADYLQNSLPGVRYKLNVTEGYIDVREAVEFPADVIDPAWVRVTDGSPRQVIVNLQASHGGLRTEGPSNCTVGFAWKSTAQFGNATAGHCADGWRSARDEYGTAHDTSYSSANVSETCTGADAQMQRMTYGAGHLARDMAGHVWYSIYDVAGGWYLGQLAVMFGYRTGTTFGTVELDSTFATPGQFDCPSPSWIYGLETTNSSQGGDSGGTLTVMYNNKLYLAGIHTGVNGVGNSVSTRINAISIPLFSHICVEVNPC